jgi:pyruvate carboxylase
VEKKNVSLKIESGSLLDDVALSELSKVSHHCRKAGHFNISANRRTLSIHDRDKEAELLEISFSEEPDAGHICSVIEATIPGGNDGLTKIFTAFYNAANLRPARAALIWRV